jgi:hypothetical protein
MRFDAIFPQNAHDAPAAPRASCLTAGKRASSSSI